MILPIDFKNYKKEIESIFGKKFDSLEEFEDYLKGKFKLHNLTMYVDRLERKLNKVTHTSSFHISSDLKKVYYLDISKNAHLLDISDEEKDILLKLEKLCKVIFPDFDKRITFNESVLHKKNKSNKNLIYIVAFVFILSVIYFINKII